MPPDPSGPGTSAPPAAGDTPAPLDPAVEQALQTFVEVGGTQQFLYELGTGVQTLDALNTLYTGGDSVGTLEHREGPFPNGQALANFAAANAAALNPAPIEPSGDTRPLSPAEMKQLEALLQLIANNKNPSRDPLTPGQRQDLERLLGRLEANPPTNDLGQLNRLIDLMGKGISKVPGGKAPGYLLNLYGKLLGIGVKGIGDIDEGIYQKFVDHMKGRQPGESVQDFLNRSPFPFWNNDGSLDRYILRYLVEQGQKQLPKKD